MIGNLEQANIIAESNAIESRLRREDELQAALAADVTEYHLDLESIAALERGDRQREMGIAQ